MVVVTALTGCALASISPARPHKKNWRAFILRRFSPRVRINCGLGAWNRISTQKTAMKIPCAKAAAEMSAAHSSRERTVEAGPQARGTVTGDCPAGAEKGLTVVPAR